MAIADYCTRKFSKVSGLKIIQDFKTLVILGEVMEISNTRLGVALLTAASFAIPSALQAADSRRLEEVVVTAERKESSVQDTSISITAFTSEMMDDFGIRNQSDLQNLIPATTIQPYDSAIRVWVVPFVTSVVTPVLRPT